MASTVLQKKRTQTPTKLVILKSFFFLSRKPTDYLQRTLVYWFPIATQFITSPT